MKKVGFTVSLIILNIISFSNVKAQSSVNEKESARVFVQKFYDLYSALYEADIPHSKGPSSQQIIMKKSNYYFDATLRKSLIEYYYAPVKDDDIGLDFDPFIAGQDSGEGYQTGNVNQIGNNFFVDVHNIHAGKTKKEILAAEIVVITQVVKVNGQWKIANFKYPPFKPNNYNLLSMLEGLRSDANKNYKN